MQAVAVLSPIGPTAKTIDPVKRNVLDSNNPGTCGHISVLAEVNVWTLFPFVKMAGNHGGRPIATVTLYHLCQKTQTLTR